MFHFHWTIQTNADFDEVLTLQQADGVAVDLTGSTFKMAVKADIDDAEALFELTTANGGIVSTDLAGGTITLVISKAQAASLTPGTHVADLLRLGGAKTELLGTFDILVKQGVTP